QLLDCGHAACGSGVQLGKHLIEAAARRAQDQDTRRLIADIAEGVTPVARTEEEAAGPDAMGRGRAFELDQQLAAQDIEGLILPGMGMRRWAQARWNHGFPE